MLKTKVALPCGSCERVFVRPKRLKNHIATQQIAINAALMYQRGVAGGDHSSAMARNAATTPTKRRRQRRRTAPPERGAQEKWSADTSDPNKLYLVPIGAGSVSQGVKGKARGEVIDLRSVSPPASVAEVSPQRTTPRWCTVNGPVVAKNSKNKEKGKEKMVSGYDDRRRSDAPTPSGTRYQPYPPKSTHLPTPSEQPSPRFKRAHSVASVQAYSELNGGGREKSFHGDSDDELDEAGDDCHDRDESSVDLDAMSIPDILGRSDTPDWSERYTPSERRTATPSAKRAYTVYDDSEDERVRWKRPRMSFTPEDASSAASSRYASLPPSDIDAIAPGAQASPENEETLSIASAERDDAEHTSRASSSPSPELVPQPSHEPVSPTRADSFQRFIDHAVALPSTTYRTRYTAIPAAGPSRAHIKENGVQPSPAARWHNPRAARVSPAPDDDDVPLLPPTTSAIPLSVVSTASFTPDNIDNGTESDKATTPSDASKDAASNHATPSRSDSTHRPTPPVDPASLANAVSVAPAVNAPSIPLAASTTSVPLAANALPAPIVATSIPAPRAGTPDAQPLLPRNGSMISAGTQTEADAVVPTKPTPNALATLPATAAMVRHGLRPCAAATCGLCHPLAHALHSLHSALSWFSWKCEGP